MKYIIAIASLLLLNSCLEVIEEVNLNDNGSGKLSYTINLSQSRTKINSLLLLDSIDGHEIPSEIEIRNKIDEVIHVIKDTEGISNVTKSLDFDNYIFKFSCDFSTLRALNKTSEVIKENYNLKDPNHNTDDHFTYDNSSRKFRRKGDYNGKADLERIKEEDLSMMKEAKFTAIYRFESEILSASNGDTKISPNKKATMLMYPLMDVITQKKEIENTITLK